jgi:hypothetical protein
MYMLGDEYLHRVIDKYIVDASGAKNATMSIYNISGSRSMAIIIVYIKVRLILGYKPI